MVEEFGTDEEILALACCGEAAHEALEDVFLGELELPGFGFGKPAREFVSLGGAVFFDGPPDEEGDVRVFGIGIVPEEVADDGEGLFGGKAFGGDCELGADNGGRVFGREMGEAGGEGGVDVPVFTGEPDGPGAEVFVL